MMEPDFLNTSYFQNSERSNSRPQNPLRSTQSQFSQDSKTFETIVIAELIHRVGAGRVYAAVKEQYPLHIAQIKEDFTSMFTDMRNYQLLRDSVLDDFLTAIKILQSFYHLDSLPISFTRYLTAVLRRITDQQKKFIKLKEQEETEIVLPQKSHPAQSPSKFYQQEMRPLRRPKSKLDQIKLDELKKDREIYARQQNALQKKQLNLKNSESSDLLLTDSSSNTSNIKNNNNNNINNNNNNINNNNNNNINNNNINNNNINNNNINNNNINNNNINNTNHQNNNNNNNNQKNNINNNNVLNSNNNIHESPKLPQETVNSDDWGENASEPRKAPKKFVDPVFDSCIVEDLEDSEEEKICFSCYICKKLTSEPHSFYGEMCATCGEFNYTKRQQFGNLKGKVALITGCRIKIGFQTTLLLLQCGAQVIGTTRFIKDAAERFAKHPNYVQYQDRLHLYRLDLLDLQSIEDFTKFVEKKYQRLDILICNAALTLEKTNDHFSYLVSEEQNAETSRAALHILHNDRGWSRNQSISPFLLTGNEPPAKAITYQAQGETFRGPFNNLDELADELSHFQQKRIQENEAWNLKKSSSNNATGSTVHPKKKKPNTDSEKSQQEPNKAKNNPNADNNPILETVSSLIQPANNNISDFTNCSSAITPLTTPSQSKAIIASGGGHLDIWNQKVDVSKNNSWTFKTSDVTVEEFLRFQIVNSHSPFILTKNLISLMKRTPGDRKFILQVSSMEGSYAYKLKSHKHVSNNMAKAALNMLVRSAAQEIVEFGIYMNAIEVGWITDNRPLHKKVLDHRQWVPPLDEIDGAARIMDPVFSGLNPKSKPVWGKFLKDYKSAPW